MPRSHSALVPTFEHGMAGDQLTHLKDLDLVGERMHLEDASTGGVGHAVEVAADADHALMGLAAGTGLGPVGRHRKLTPGGSVPDVA